MGVKVKGKGTIRDLLEIENLSKTNWAAIFKSRLSAYSNEKTKTKAWNRRFVAGRRMATSRLPSKTKEMDTLPELNLILDTSSSIGKSELQLILSEVNVALQAAKIKTLNLLMWHHQPYYYKKYKDVTSKNFIEVIDDVRNNWEGGGNDDIALYQKIIELGIAKNFTISITDGYIDDITRPGTKANEVATKALDPQQTIFGIIFPNKSMPYSTWSEISNRFIGTKLPIFLETSKFQ
jgi:predicted metal-dependent peptidase